MDMCKTLRMIQLHSDLCVRIGIFDSVIQDILNGVLNENWIALNLGALQFLCNNFEIPQFGYRV